MFNATYMSRQQALEELIISVRAESGWHILRRNLNFFDTYTSPIASNSICFETQPSKLSQLQRRRLFRASEAAGRQIDNSNSKTIREDRDATLCVPAPDQN